MDGAGGGLRGPSRGPDARIRQRDSVWSSPAAPGPAAPAPALVGEQIEVPPAPPRAVSELPAPPALAADSGRPDDEGALSVTQPHPAVLGLPATPVVPEPDEGWWAAPPPGAEPAPPARLPTISEATATDLVSAVEALVVRIREISTRDRAVRRHADLVDLAVSAFQRSQQLKLELRGSGGTPAPGPSPESPRELPADAPGVAAPDDGDQTPRRHRRRDRRAERRAADAQPDQAGAPPAAEAITEALVVDVANPSPGAGPSGSDPPASASRRERRRARRAERRAPRGPERPPGSARLPSDAATEPAAQQESGAAEPQS